MAQIRNILELNGGLEDLFAFRPDLRDKLISLRMVRGACSDDKRMRPDEKSYEYQFTFQCRLKDRIQSNKYKWEIEEGTVKDRGDSIIEVFAINQRYFTNPESNPPKLCLSADIYVSPVAFIPRDSSGANSI